MKTKGFTLIELIAVVVILGVIAAAAVPRFVDLSQAARESAAEGVAGSLGSASALNHANGILAVEQYSGISSPLPVLSCDDASYLLDGGLPDGYRVIPSSGSTGNVSHSDTIECLVQDQNDTSVTAEFVLHGFNPPP